MSNGTLSRRLVLGVTALVALIAIALSGLTALTMSHILTDQVDEQLRATAQRVRGSNGEMMPGGRGGPGQQQGLLVYVRGSGGYLQVERSHDVVSDAVVEALEALPTGDYALTRTLPSLGSYRLLTLENPSGSVIVGQPMSAVTGPMTSLLAAAAALTLLAIGLAFLAARALVERSLRPLARLTSTAQTVSTLELSSGEVAVPVRASDTDPRSEVGKVGIAFNHMLDNVEGALAARQASETKVRQFVADASHELRNPLASIRGYAELTRRERDAVPPTTAHALTRIESESERMSHLVEDLLLLARLDSGGPNLALAPVDLTPLVADAVSDARAASPDHHWELAVPDAPVMAVADRFRIQQVVANLLSNARTHTPAGTRVEASLTTEGPWVVIAITDAGPGIPPDLHDRVFERFTRADASRVRSDKTQSTGLGLAIVAAVVRAHGGEVAVESEPGRTRFTVRVPRA